jgi:hypothetical protein
MDEPEGDKQSDGKESDEKDDEGFITVIISWVSHLIIIDLESKNLLPRKAVTKKTQPHVTAPEKMLLEEDWEM